jgi:hypothetical protein
MQKSFLYYSTLAAALSFSTIQAMEDDTRSDPVHDSVFKQMIADHKLEEPLKQWLRPATNKPVKIFDINDIHKRRCAEVHAMARKKAVDPIHSISFISTLLSIPITVAASPYYLGKFLWNSSPNIFTSSTPPVSKTSKGTLTDVSSQPHLNHLQHRKDEDPSFEGGAVKENPDYMVLGLMGGGLRARMEAKWLVKLSKLTNRPIYELFDQIAGTSAGGFLALGLTLSQDGKTPVKSASQIEDLIINQAPQFFPQEDHYKWNVLAKLKDGLSSLFYTQYDATTLETYLKKDFGDVTLSTALTRVCVTTVRADENEIYLLGSDSHPEVFGRIAGRATGAAPTYFEGVQFSDNGKPPFTLVDGGVGANDPTLIAMMKVKQWAQKRQSNPFSYNQLTVVTFGTGDMPVANFLSLDAGKLGAAAAVVEMAMSTNVSGTHSFIKETLPEKNYLYCNPKLTEPTGLDILTPEQARDLDQAAESEMVKIENFFENNEVLRKRLERLSPGEQGAGK